MFSLCKPFLVGDMNDFRLLALLTFWDDFGMLSVLAIAVAFGMVFLSSNIFRLLLSMRHLELSGTLHTEASPWPTHVGCCHTNPYRVPAGRFQVEEPSHVQTVGSGLHIAAS